MAIETTRRATTRYVTLEIATLAPTVVLWTLVLGVADFTSALVIWGLRIATLAFVWARLVEPARRWHRLRAELDDRDLVAIDGAMASNPQRFTRIYTATLVSTMVLGLVLGVLGLPRTIAIGPAELVGATMFVAAIAIVIVPMQSWLWEPFESSRIELGTLLRERGLVGQRDTSTILRSLLWLSTGTTLAIYIGCFGLGGMVHIQGRRATTLAQQVNHAEIQAMRLRAAGGASSGVDEGARVVTDAELPSSLRDRPDHALTEVTLASTQAIAAAPVGDGRWVIASKTVDEQLGWFVIISFGVGIMLAVPLTGTTVAQAGSLTDQLLALGKLTRRVRESGKIRGLTRVVSLRNDEVDGLVKDFNAMLDMFDELSAAATTVAAGDLRVVLERPGDLHDAFRAMIERLHGMVVQIRGTALDLASAAAEIHSITQEQAQAAELQSASVREVSETVASLAASAENITQTAAGVLENADQTLATTGEMIAKIDELSGQANGVGSLLDLIREIADRSDLLALNGSLEATRVGEAGRGFALVAAEMRRLAERVTQTVGDVRERVVEIKSSSASAVRVGEQGRVLAERTAAAARHITQVTRRQSHETEQAAQTVHEVAGVVIATAGATAQTRAAAEGLRLQAEQLERLTRQFKLRRETGNHDLEA